MKKTEEQAKAPLRLLCVGSPLLDIAARCGQETLDRYGLKSDDCIREGEGQAAIFQWLLRHPDSRMNAGGSAQNTARVAKWVMAERGRVAFAGCVGRDDFAGAMRDRLSSEGVEPLYVTLDGHPTGSCACLLRAGAERSMIARLGAAEHLAERHLEQEDIRKAVEGAQCMFLEGYLLGHSPDVVQALADNCAPRQVFSLGLSAEYVSRDFSALLLRVLPRVDILFSNDAEAFALAEALGLGPEATVDDIARDLATRDRPSFFGPRIVVVTRGPQPLLVARGSEVPVQYPVPSGITVVDSVGCGDALAGGFLAEYVLSGDLREAARTGIAAAVEIAQASGCNPPTHRTLFGGSNA